MWRLSVFTDVLGNRKQAQPSFYWKKEVSDLIVKFQSLGKSNDNQPDILPWPTECACFLVKPPSKHLRRSRNFHFDTDRSSQTARPIQSISDRVTSTLLKNFKGKISSLVSKEIVENIQYFQVSSWLTNISSLQRKKNNILFSTYHKVVCKNSIWLLVYLVIDNWGKKSIFAIFQSSWLFIWWLDITLKNLDVWNKSLEFGLHWLKINTRKNKALPQYSIRNNWDFIYLKWQSKFILKKKWRMIKKNESPMFLKGKASKLGHEINQLDFVRNRNSAKIIRNYEINFLYWSQKQN